MKMIASQFIETGLIQFGGFGDNLPQSPIKFQLEMLASYPDLLDHIAQNAIAQISHLKIDHLVCMPDAIPLGVAISLNLKVPLVYTRGVGDIVTFVGAYDIGHPALLLMNTIHSNVDDLLLIQQARRVGLEIRSVFGVIDCGISQSRHIGVKSLLRLTELTEYLLESNQLSIGQAQAISNWNF